MVIKHRWVAWFTIALAVATAFLPVSRRKTLAQPSGSGNAVLELEAARTAWFRDAKFAMFIRWGRTFDN
jgi:hypothetical protein